jgi:hypothetical protein
MARARQRWHQLDRRVRSVLGDACLVGKSPEGWRQPGGATRTPHPGRRGSRAFSIQAGRTRLRRAGPGTQESHLPCPTRGNALVGWVVLVELERG